MIHEWLLAIPMGTQAQFQFQFQFLLQAPTYVNSSDYYPVNPNNIVSTNKSKILTCYSTRSRSNWNPSNAEPKVTGNGRFRFNLENELYTGGDDDDDDDGFSAKSRNWWSDYNDFDDDWELDDEDESWIFKALKAFGWMLPAIAIPLLLGTAPNALFMALIPLGQSILSLAFDKVRGRNGNIPRSRPGTKRKKKPFARAASDTKTSQGKQENRAANGRRSYQSWVVPDGVPYEKCDRSIPEFGGWDDLEEKVRNHGYRATRKPPSQMKSERPKQLKKGKLSRVGRIREKPLLFRLLIAIFPFLGSWTKLLF